MTNPPTIASRQLDRLEQELQVWKALKWPLSIGAIGVLIWGYMTAQIMIALLIAAFMLLFAFLQDVAKPRVYGGRVEQIRNNRKVPVRATLHSGPPTRGQLWWICVESFVNEADRRPVPQVLYVSFLMYQEQQFLYFCGAEPMETKEPTFEALVKNSLETMDKGRNDPKIRDCELVFDDANDEILAVFTPVGVMIVGDTSKTKYLTH